MLIKGWLAARGRGSGLILHPGAETGESPGLGGVSGRLGEAEGERTAEIRGTLDRDQEY